MKWTVTLAALLLTVAPAAAKVVTYPLPTAGTLPGRILGGPGDTAWFTETHYAEDELDDRLARIDSAGTVTDVTSSFTWGRLSGIVSTAGGAIAVAGPYFGQISEFSPTGEQTADYRIPGGELSPVDLVRGGDGRLWFLAQPPVDKGPGAVGVIAADGTVSTWPVAGLPWRITSVGTDALWFTEHTPDGGVLGRITTAGELTERPLGNVFPYAITSESDGTVWLTDASGRVGRIVNGGELRWFDVGASGALSGIAANPEGGVVVGDLARKAILVISPSGRVRTIPVVGGAPGEFAARRAGGMWFTIADIPVGRPGQGGIGLLSQDELHEGCHVPDLVGQPLRRAALLLRDADCRLGGVVRRTHRGPRNVVLAQSPRAGLRLRPGHGIALAVSR